MNSTMERVECIACGHWQHRHNAEGCTVVAGTADGLGDSPCRCKAGTHEALVDDQHTVPCARCGEDTDCADYCSTPTAPHVCDECTDIEADRD